MTDAPELELLVGQLRAVGLPAPEREYLFTPVPPVTDSQIRGLRPLRRRRWRFDLAWPTADWSGPLAVELDGSVFTGGRHGGTPSAIRDIEKQNAAQLLGWTVLRVVPAQVRSGAAVNLIEVAFGERHIDEILYARQGGRHVLRQATPVPLQIHKARP